MNLSFMQDRPTLAEQQATRRKNAKQEPSARTKGRKDRLDAKQLKAFRDAVWERELVDVLVGDRVQVGRCNYCDCLVYRKIYLPVGEVHHRIGRRSKASRYDPMNGVLLCRDCHGKAQRHEIAV